MGYSRLTLRERERRRAKEGGWGLRILGAFYLLFVEETARYHNHNHPYFPPPPPNIQVVEVERIKLAIFSLSLHLVGEGCVYWRKKLYIYQCTRCVAGGSLCVLVCCLLPQGCILSSDYLILIICLTCNCCQ